MQDRFKLAISFLGLWCFCLPACVGEADPLEDDGGTAERKLLTRNAFTKEALVESALTTDRPAMEALTGNPLTSAGIASSSDVMSALRDPLAREFLMYVAGCALPAGQSVKFSVDGEAYTFEGSIGLASEWGRDHGKCNAHCQGWISACMLARINHVGESMPISMRGKHKALDSDQAERERFPNREAAYFGDLFAPEQLRFACKSPGSTLISRVCGGTGVDTQGCIVDVLGECDDFCGAPASDGSFPNCVGGGHTTPTTVTVFRE
ncbi:hypothetical protein WME90_08800 [Sorangium sp. So ce375]|uniref:hypothetical protein n=1 Tax=Sorangium sp. So ce375 TaxID=3133306 RepID=UPI003F5B61DB